MEDYLDYEISEGWFGPMPRYYLINPNIENILENEKSQTRMRRKNQTEPIKFEFILLR